MLLLSPCDDKELCQRRPPVPVTNAAYQRISPELGDLGCFYGSGFGMWELQSAYPLVEVRLLDWTCVVLVGSSGKIYDCGIVLGT